MTENTLIVHEQYDGDGDLIYAVTLRTYSRRALDQLAHLLETDVAFAPPHDVAARDYAHDHSTVSA